MKSFERCRRRCAYKVCGQTDGLQTDGRTDGRRTDGWTDRLTGGFLYIPQTMFAGGITKLCYGSHLGLESHLSEKNLKKTTQDTFHQRLRSKMAEKFQMKSLFNYIFSILAWHPFRLEITAIRHNFTTETLKDLFN